MRILRWAVQTNARYIGMIGSKRKVLTIYKELEQEGLDPQLFERVMAPVGLEIGAVTPEEIAVSIVAEMIACKRNAEGVLGHKRQALSRAAKEGHDSPGKSSIVPPATKS
jgi:xanthine dehydrogenase accessory factor